jgi:hypothetical protein
MAFKPFTIRYNPEIGMFESGEAIAKEKTSRKFVLMNLTKQDHDNRLGAIFKSVEKLTYNEIVEDLKKIYGVGSNITKQQIIPYLVGNGFLNKTDGLYSLT